jgi:hypothetical protein
MLYIHRLSDLNPKSAEIESTLIIRELKRKIKLPITKEIIEGELQTIFISDTDSQSISNAISLINPTADEINKIFDKNDPLYEPINMKRAMDILREMPDPLFANLNYAEYLKNWKQNFIAEFVDILNNIPKLTKKEDQEAYNKKLNDIFEKLLRRQDLFFNSAGLINEANIEHIEALNSSMENGFLFHILLEEEIHKVKFSIIRNRIPKDELAIVESLKQKIATIKDGIDRAYAHNLRIVQLAVILYSYIRLVTNR